MTWLRFDKMVSHAQSVVNHQISTGSITRLPFAGANVSFRAFCYLPQRNRGRLSPKAFFEKG